MSALTLGLIIALTCVLIAEFVNGWTDAPNAIATVVSTGVMSPRTAVAIAQSIALSAYDIDGDGETRAETDGLLLLRAMLGFRGDALITGVIGTNATRRTAQDVQAFLTNACGMLIN